MTRIAGILHEDLCTFVTKPGLILLGMRNVSGKICRGNQNTHFVFKTFFRKWCSLWDGVEKYGSARDATCDSIIFIYLLIFSIKQILSWEANRFSASQIPRILWNPNVHYRVYKCPHLSLSSARSIQSMPPILFPEDLYYWYPPIYACVFQVVSFPQVSPPKPRLHLSPIPAACCTHLILLDWSSE